MRTERQGRRCRDAGRTLQGCREDVAGMQGDLAALTPPEQTGWSACNRACRRGQAAATGTGALAGPGPRPQKGQHF